MMPTLSSWKNIGACFLLCASAAISSSAQTFTTLFTFDDTNGRNPEGTLLQGLDGNLWGTTKEGGHTGCFNGCGTVFKITPDGTLTTVHFFSNQGSTYYPIGLTLANNGNFYGFAEGAGSSEFFELAPNGTFTALESTGLDPSSPLLQAANGLFYGVEGGASGGNGGEAFSGTTTGGITLLHGFCSENSCGGTAAGFDPIGGLIQGTDQDFYGTASQGGTASNNCAGTPSGGTGCGTIFRMGPAGRVVVLHAFTGSDGIAPVGGLVQGTDGNFYGTTSYGGASILGTVFKMSPSGTLTTLYSFCGGEPCVNGNEPLAGLVQGSDGNFYGTTSSGGDTSCGGGSGCGTIFRITPEGAISLMYAFEVTAPGVNVELLQATDGNFYGTTQKLVGSSSYGTVFKLSLGLAPFVKAVPAAAFTGSQVFILGNNLTGATSVTFNGKPAAFTVVSATEITATVPTSATNGKIKVVTPGGTLSSNFPFRVF
jgi:uncharacterized repeat protein (TIGR03803 family)